jgi:hypothetical protein
VGVEVAQIMCTHISKCKNHKIKLKYKRKKRKEEKREKTEN